MATFVFDTHRAVKDLAEAGFPEAQAEALVELVGAAVGENAATKGDLDAMEGRVTARFEAKFAAMEQQTAAQFAAQKQQTDAQFAALEQRMVDWFAAQKQQTDAQIEAQKQQTDAQIAAAEQRLNARIEAAEQRQNARSDALEQRLTVKFIAILLPSLGLLFAALRFLS